MKGDKSGKIQPDFFLLLNVSNMIVQGSHTFAMFTSTRIVKKGGYPERTYTHVRDDLYPTPSKQHSREYACNVWLYPACSYIVGPEKTGSSSTT